MLAVTREIVNIALSQTVKVQKMRRSLRILLRPAVISVVVTEKSKINARKLMNRLHRLVFCSVLQCVIPPFLMKLKASNSW